MPDWDEFQQADRVCRNAARAIGAAFSGKPFDPQPVVRSLCSAFSAQLAAARLFPTEQVTIDTDLLSPSK